MHSSSTTSLEATTILTQGGNKTLDGVAWSTIGSADFKWYEVNRYVMRPTFGVASHLLLMNLETWQNLPLDLQRLLLDEGAKLEQRAVTRLSKTAAGEINDLNVAGMQVTSLCRQGARRMKHNWAAGVWQLAIDKSGDEARALRDLAYQAGVTPSFAQDTAAEASLPASSAASQP